MMASADKDTSKTETSSEPEILSFVGHGTSTDDSATDAIPLKAAPTDAVPPDWRISGNPVSDQSTLHDKLGFRPYVDAVAAFLKHEDTRPPLTMSVEGEWGTGKSSFMRQLKAALDEPPEIRPALASDRPRRPFQRTYLWLQRVLRLKPRPSRLTFWFNAWRHDTRDAMWATFALSITKKLRDGENTPRRIVGDVKLAASRIKTLGGWVHTLGVLLLWLIVALGAAGVVAYPFNLTPPQRSDFIRKFLTLVGAKESQEIKQNHAKNSDTNDAEMQPLKTSVFALFVGRMSAAHYWFTALFALGLYLFWVRKHAGKQLELKLERYLSKPDYDSRVSFIESFHEDFQKVVKAYAGNRKVFIFVDDLDRCDVPKAAELMQAINLMIGDDDHLVFILGMDREKVAAGITLKFKDIQPLLDRTKETEASARHPAAFGYLYLEKFIQVTFRVPRPSESGIQEFLDSLASSVEDLKREEGRKRADQAVRRERRRIVEVKSRADSKEVHAQIKLVAPVLQWNPRRIKQFINDFRLQAYIASDLGLLDLVASEDEPESARISLEQLGKFVAITLAWPDLVMDLIGFPRLLSEIYKTYAQVPSKERGESAFEDDTFTSQCDESQDSANLDLPHRKWLIDRWSREPLLKDLLLAGCNNDDGAKYSLACTDLRVFLNITPKVSRSLYGSMGVVAPHGTELRHGYGVSSSEAQNFEPRPSSSYARRTPQQE